MKVLRRCCRSLSEAFLALVLCERSWKYPPHLWAFMFRAWAVEATKSSPELLRSTCMNQGSCNHRSVESEPSLWLTHAKLGSLAQVCPS